MDAQDSVVMEDDESCLSSAVKEDEAKQDDVNIVGEEPSTFQAADVEGNCEETAFPRRSQLLSPMNADKQCCSKEINRLVTVENEKSAHSRETLRPRILTPSCWILNDEKYLAKISELLEHSFDDEHLTRVQARSFIERKRKAKRKRDRKEREFWTEPDPHLDAWMLVVGERRDVIDLDALVTKHPEVYTFVQRVREKVNVQVLACSCPVYNALQNVKNGGESEECQEHNDVDSQGLPRRPILSSQTYWTKVKGWRPW